MSSESAILDFPGTGRLRFSSPQQVIEAMDLASVRPALQAAEAAARAGAHVVGFVAYEAAPAFDPALRTRPAGGPLPLLWFGVFGEPDRLPAAGGTPEADGPTSHETLSWEPAGTRAEYDAAIDSIRSAIAAGDVYQVNHTLRFTAASCIPARALYDALAAARHGRYHALIESDAWAIVSASPELFLDVCDGCVTTRPMKGTIRRGRWLAEDRAAADALAGSAKDRAENLMIVDLLRNDLGRVAQFGTVTVPELFRIETYPTVHQLTSTVSAQLRDGISLDDIFAAAFPCGSIAGAPKVAAMQMIATLETGPRGAYCGAIGIIRPDGSATFNVAIRTLQLDTRRGTAVYGPGGGITWDSHADIEYDEVVAKAALLHQPRPAFDLLETMRMDDGVIRRRSLHLHRLQQSALYFDWLTDVHAEAVRALDAFQAAAPNGSWRNRLTAARDGTVNVQRTQLTDPPGSMNDDVAPLTVALGTVPMPTHEPLLCHKTTARELYETQRAAQPHVFDVLLRTASGHITEFTIGNVVLEIDGVLLTPLRSAGLLNGTFREELLQAGVIGEAALTVVDARRATRMWMINSVREWAPVQLDGNLQGAISRSAGK